MPTSDTDHYLAVLKVSYDYSPQSDDEIAVNEGQLLFLIERTDEDWWKVKVKGDSQDADTPVGLVPAAYVEQVEHTHLVKALYDYEATAPGELTVSEDDVLLAFEMEGDWLLVQGQNGEGGVGYVPGNYVEETAEGTSSPPEKIIVPPSAPQPVSTYVDPADRVAASKVTADDIKTWSVAEVDKKGKKKKGTLGIGNGALFFASESDKTPVQKWRTSDIIDISTEKSKHVEIEIGGTVPISLLFNVGSKTNVEDVVNKLESSRELAKPSSQGSPVGESSSRFIAPQKSPEKGTVRFSAASPTIIPSREEEEADEEEQGEEQEHHPAVSDQPAAPKGIGGEPAIALYEFTADGDDELTVAEGEEVLVIEHDGDEWWKCRNSHGVEGVVPASYLEFKVSSSLSPPRTIPPEQEGEKVEVEAKSPSAAAARAAQDRAEVDRLRREGEEQAAREQKKQEAQRRAQEAAAAEAERQKRKEAAAAAAVSRKSPSPKAESKEANSSGRKSQEVTFPPVDKVRTWHDRTGQFRVDAALLGFANGKLRLHKINGVIVEVPSEKMSVDDMKYVEKLSKKSSRPPLSSQRVSEDDIPLGHLQSVAAAATATAPPSKAQLAPPPKKGPRIDWFDFFLSAGCDIDDCTRYASAFERDKIDESIISDITDSTMRSLGLREGDIIRVRKTIEKRRPGENMEKPSAYVLEQMRRDEELARQLQAQESGGGSTRSPAPNLFAGPGGVLKGRRGRLPLTKTLPTNVDLNALSSVSEQIQRTTSPQVTNPSGTRPGSAPAPAARSGSTPTPAATGANGFEDDAWTVRPSSAKPAAAASPPSPPVVAAAPSPAQPIAAMPPAPSVSAPPATTATALSHAPVTTASAPAPQATTAAPGGLSKTTESDIFDQLARLSQLRQTTPQPPVFQQSTQSPPATTPSLVPPSFSAGFGLGNSSLPMGQALTAQQAGLLQPSISPQPQLQLQPQPTYNGPRGPFAPVPANQALLQPLIPTQTGFNSFVPTRPNNNTSPFQSQLSPSPFAGNQPAGVQNTVNQPLMTNPTGIPSAFGVSPFGSGSIFQSNNTLNPLVSQPTGVFAQSPFNNPSSPPPVPPLPSLAPNIQSTSPANVFASMKSGTFAKDEDYSAPQSSDRYNALRPNVALQQTGWGYGGQSGF